MGERDEQVELRTTAGALKIQLFGREAPLASQCFMTQYRAGAWDAAKFFRIDAGALYFGSASSVPPVQYHEETHPRLRFQKRGAVAFARGNTLELVFSRGTGAVPAVGSVFGCVTPESLYILESIANMPSNNGALLYPVGRGAEARPSVQPEPKRRRIKIHLKDESDEDELPQASARSLRSAAPSTAPSAAPSTTLSADPSAKPERSQPPQQRGCGDQTNTASSYPPRVSEELQSLLAFEQRLRESAFSA